MWKNTAGLRDYIGGSWRMLILSLVPAVSLLLTTRVDGKPWVSDPSIVSTPLLLRSRRKSHKCVASSTSSTLVSTHVSMQLITDMAACTTRLHTCTHMPQPAPTCAINYAKHQRCNARARYQGRSGGAL